VSHLSPSTRLDDGSGPHPKATKAGRVGLASQLFIAALREHHAFRNSRTMAGCHHGTITVADGVSVLPAKLKVQGVDGHAHCLVGAVLGVLRQVGTDIGATCGEDGGYLSCRGASRCGGDHQDAQGRRSYATAYQVCS
jgi:hypothetical protein